MRWDLDPQTCTADGENFDYSSSPGHTRIDPSSGLGQKLRNFGFPFTDDINPPKSYALLWACAEGLPELVKLLLAEGAGHFTSVRPPRNRTDCHCCHHPYQPRAYLYAIHYAATAGVYETLELLLDAGANPEVHDFDGDGPLHTAASHNHPQLIRLLVSRGVSVNSRNSKTETVAHIAASFGYREVIETVRKLGADFLCLDSDGCNPLHISSAKGHLEVTKLLIEKGFDISSVSSYGDTPLHLGARFGRKAIMYDLPAVLR